MMPLGLALIIACVGATARVQVPGPSTPHASAPEAPPRQTVAICAERTNGCIVCKRYPDGVEHCSLPGIACQPAAWRCMPDVTRPIDSQPAR